jgi:hypothetical protein
MQLISFTFCSDIFEAGQQTSVAFPPLFSSLPGPSYPDRTAVPRISEHTHKHPEEIFLFRFSLVLLDIDKGMGHQIHLKVRQVTH